MTIDQIEFLRDLAFKAREISNDIDSLQIGRKDVSKASMDIWFAANDLLDICLEVQEAESTDS